jgi:Cu/Ag efflux pump CusA
VASILAIAVIFLLLYGEFKNLSLAAIIMLNLPMALIGGIFAIFFTTDIVSIPSIIGFITLFGVATRNGILLISRYSHMQEAGKSLRETVMQGSIDRLSPILMTAVSSALALVPLVLRGSATGNEIQAPMAVVILGGLITAMLLNIYIVPMVYETIQKRRIT